MAKSRAANPRREPKTQSIKHISTYSKGETTQTQSPIKILTGKTPGQQRYLAAMRKSDVTIVDGMAGTGKTFLAVGFGIEQVRAGNAKRIIVARPAVEAGENLGFQPGDVGEKMGPYVEPIYEALRHFLPSEGEYRAAIDPVGGCVKMVPLAFMRGHNFRDAVAILDEAQNATEKQIRLFVQRACQGTKLVIVGSSLQCDLPQGPRGFDRVFDCLAGGGWKSGTVSACELGPEDNQRHGLTAEIEQRMMGMS